MILRCARLEDDTDLDSLGLDPFLELDQPSPQTPFTFGLRTDT